MSEGYLQEKQLNWLVVVSSIFAFSIHDQFTNPSFHCLIFGYLFVNILALAVIIHRFK